MGLDQWQEPAKPGRRGVHIQVRCCRTGAVRAHRRRRAARWRSCYVGRVDRFVLPAAASIVVGLLLGAAAIFGVTLMVQQDTKPPLQAGDPASSVLNRVEYGDRS